MSEETDSPTGETPSPPPSGSTAGLGVKKNPKEVVPSDRMTTEKYLEVLRAFAAASDASSGPVDNKQAGAVINQSDNTVVISNPWLCDIGALNRVGNGQFEVTQPAKDYAQAYEWKAPDAGEKLKPLLQDKWFTKVLQPRLRFKELSLEASVGVLAQACNSSPHYRVNLERIVQFMDVAGLCRIEGSMVFPVLDKMPDPGGSHSDKKDAPHTPAVPIGDVVPLDAPFMFLDRGRTRKVTLLAPHSLTLSEANKIKAWIDLVLFIDEDA